MKLSVVIAAYNEGKQLGTVLRGIPKRLPGIDEIEVVVVSDGSHDDTADVACEAGATVLTHKINRGQGAALQTGFEYSRRHGADIVRGRGRESRKLSARFRPYDARLI